MKEVKIIFDKNLTAIIKGVAIIFMIVLHVFGGSGWYEPSYNIPLNHNDGLIHFMHSFQICVGIYVFMIGFGYSFCKIKDFAYSLKHIKRLLCVFWTILLLMALPAGYNCITGNELILNLFGINEQLSWVSWFVYLYIWAMIVMPFIGRIIDRRPILFGLFMIISMYVGQCIVYLLNPEYYHNIWLNSLFVCLGWTPLIIIGYISGRMQLFDQIKYKSKKYIPVLAILTICLVLWLKSIVSGVLILNFDIFYAPLIILSLIIIFSQWKGKVLKTIFRSLGEYSVYMWFIHGLFFTAATRSTYQPLIMISDNLWIIALWTILLSYLISIPVKRIVEY